MKLSILIPTFDYDCTRLVEQLTGCVRESALGADAEIVVGDDASRDAAVVAALDALPALDAQLVRLVRAARNLGRAAMRNRLADEARGEWLLFVDSDACVPPSFSLRSYVEAAGEADVVCGGLCHPAVNPNAAATLRYRYERHADGRRAARFRQLHPYRHMSTFNLLVRRALFQSIRFDERCTDYGYEDALFGLELMRRGVPVVHVDQWLVHVGLEPNDVFLAKTETALRTLRRLGGQMERYSHVGRMALRVRHCGMAAVVRWVFRCTRPLLRRQLLGRRPSLLLFAFYKLGFFLSLPR
jgi:glycosyltransferase involved in cell wall biosynthesis